MNPALSEAGERLVAEFPHEPTSTVIRVLAECAEQFPDSDLMFIEQAARARLTRDRSVTESDRPSNPKHGADPVPSSLLTRYP